MACDDEVLPGQNRIDAITDGANFEGFYETERRLLHIGCAQARNHLWVRGRAPVFEFLRDSVPMRASNLKDESQAAHWNVPKQPGPTWYFCAGSRGTHEIRRSLINTVEQLGFGQGC